MSYFDSSQFSTIAQVASTGATAYSQIQQGNVARAEANTLASGYQQQAKALEAQKTYLNESKKLETIQYARQRRAVMGTIAATTAKSGLKLSGSPLSVALNDLTQLRIDESIGAFNIDLAGYNTTAKQNQYLGYASAARNQGKVSLAASRVDAFSTLLKGASSIFVK